MTTSTTIPAMLAAFTQTAKTAAAAYVADQADPTFDVLVSDGPVVTDARNFLYLGWTGREGEPGVQAALSGTGIRGRKDHESYDVHSVLSVWYGGGDEPSTDAARLIAFEILDVLDDAVVDDLTLGGVVDSARLTGFDVESEIAGNGASATVSFTYHVEAFRRQPQ